MENIVDELILSNKTISTMESCTGGFVASSITNISGSSKVFKFGAVTYSNEYKIRMGVNEDVINEYSVYSIETAKEMSKKISDFTNSDYGVGVTGTINEIDPNNNLIFRPKGGVQLFVQIPDNIILEQWGSKMQIAQGGYIIITDPSDMYGISERDFTDTYRKVSESNKNLH